MAGWELVIPFWHPAKVNELYAGHWTRRRKLKRMSRDLVAAYARKANTPKATGKRRVTLKVVLKPRQRGGDVDAYFKDLCDSLTHAGLIVDDNRQHLELAPVQYFRGTAERWGSVITLEDL